MNGTERPAVTVGVPEGAIAGDQIVPCQDVIAAFTAPDGTPGHQVKVRLFQIGPVIGVGVYPCGDRGVVLRWDDGPLEDPRVIYWQAPHCADDECGSPCSHEDSR